MTVPQTHKAFLLTEGEPDITIDAEFGTVPPAELGEVVFRTNGVWGLYRGKDKLIFHFLAREIVSTPYKLAIIEPDFSSGIIYSRITESGQKIVLIHLTILWTNSWSSVSCPRARACLYMPAL